MENICAKNTYISNTCIIGTYIRYASFKDIFTKCIYTRSIFHGGVKPKALVRSGVTLAGLGINDYCLQLFIRFIFVSIEGVNY